MFDVLKWGNAASNRFWTTIYKGSLWLSRHVAAQAIHDAWNMADPGQRFLIWRLSQTQEAFGALARLSADQGWRLWYLRPKVHMFQHIVRLGHARL